MIVGSLATSGWLLATGQAATVDGLFLLICALLIAGAFALYVMFMIRRAIEAVTPAPPPVVRAAPAPKPAAPATASQV
jgi:hypothetical protein